MWIRALACVPQLIVCLTLLWGIKTHNRYGYYILLRWVCCAGFAILAFQALSQKKHAWVCVVAITAVVYNPIIRIHLARDTWSIVDATAIGIAVASIFVLNVKNRGEK